jgi:hypothetical protein
MDHWLDAIIVPLTTVGITVALEMPPWAIAAVNVTAAMVYHGQLVLYHHTGKFLHPEPATGTEAQLGLSVGYVALAPLYYFIGRDHAWLDLTVAGIAVLGLFIQMKCNSFYYVRLGSLVRYHLIFVAYGAGWAALYLLGAIDVYAFLLAVVFTSFRICGTYVLFTIVRRRFGGGDLGIALLIAAAFGVRFLMDQQASATHTLQSLLPYLACAYAIGRNLADFSRHYSELRSSTG